MVYGTFNELLSGVYKETYNDRKYVEIQQRLVSS